MPFLNANYKFIAIGNVADDRRIWYWIIAIEMTLQFHVDLHASS